MSFNEKITDPPVRAYFKTKYGGGSGGSGGGESGGDNFPIGDGNTHIWISLPEGRTNPVLGVAVNGTVTVDWGDGSEPDTLTGTSTKSARYTPNHEYGKAGDYVITLSGDGNVGFVGDASYGSNLLAVNDNNMRHVYMNAIKKVECGNHVTNIGDSAFNRCYSLVNVAISDSVTNIGSYAFNTCYSLINVTIPDSVTSISRSCFLSCYSLLSATISGGVKTINGSTFSGCYSLVSVTVPDSVTSISGSAFDKCYAVVCFDFTKHTSVPTLASTSAFTGIPSDCIFKIPASLYDEWIAATNWSAVADKIVGV